jgi:glycosyltransferase involved in cell wall biosynthesis
MPVKHIYIIIPCYNESRVIGDVTNALSGEDYEIVLVDDGSAVDPGSFIKTPVIILRHEVNLGQGAALQTGIEFALASGAEYIVTFDGDGQHSPADIKNLLEPLINGEADITLASRFLEKGSHNASAGRKLVLKAGTWVNYLFTGLYLTDSHNGLRAMNRKAALAIDLKENRMAHATEFLLSIQRKKLRYKEVPATVRYTDYSRRKGQSVFNSIRIFFDLVLHKLFE